MSTANEPSHVDDARAEFDQYVGSYDDILNKALSMSGEDKYFFALCRINWMRERFQRIGFSPNSLLDFGCGTGTSTPFFFDLLDVAEVVGVDVSTASLEVAQQAHGSAQARFLPTSEFEPSGHFDLAFCNGVFHHIPPAERSAAVECVYRALRPGGLFAFWENNPWNLGARYCMRVNPFDQNAIMLAPHQARALLRSAGFEIADTNYLFVFPRLLAWFRRLEPYMFQIPIGAQYLVVARKPQE